MTDETVKQNTDEQMEAMKTALDDLLNKGRNSVANIIKLAGNINEELHKENLTSYKLWQLSKFSQTWVMMTNSLLDLHESHLKLAVDTAKKNQEKENPQKG